MSDISAEDVLAALEPSYSSALQQLNANAGQAAATLAAANPTAPMANGMAAYAPITLPDLQTRLTIFKEGWRPT